MFLYVILRLKLTVFVEWETLEHAESYQLLVAPSYERLRGVSLWIQIYKEIDSEFQIYNEIESIRKSDFRHIKLSNLFENWIEKNVNLRVTLKSTRKSNYQNFRSRRDNHTA